MVGTCRSHTDRIFDHGRKSWLAGRNAPELRVDVIETMREPYQHLLNAGSSSDAENEDGQRYLIAAYSDQLLVAAASDGTIRRRLTVSREVCP